MKTDDYRLFRFMMKYTKKFTPQILLSFFLLLATTVLQLIQPVIIGLVIDKLIHNESTQFLEGIRQYGLIFLLLLLLRSFLIFFQSTLIGNVGQHILYAIRNDLFSHILHLDLQYFDRMQTGKVVTRISNDTETLNEMYTSVLMNVIKDLFIISGVITASFFVNVYMACILITMFPFLGLTVILFRKFARNNYSKLRTQIALLNGFLSETMTGIRTIQLYNRLQTKFREFLAINLGINRAYIGEITLYGVFRPLFYLITQIVFMGILYSGAAFFIGGSITLGILFIFIQYLNIMNDPIYELSEQFNILQSALSATEKIDETLSVQPAITAPGEFHLIPDRITGKIEFDHVWFAYSDGEWVLKDVSFTILPGESIAIVGPTGSGKTTIISLLCRYYEVTRGEIRIDGIPVTSYDPDVLRSSISMVMQDVFIFAGTFKENIRLFNESVSDNDVRRAAGFVHADTFITAYQSGYDHYIEERGATLSGGQRQLLSFARAMIHDNPILILDEATAHIDTATELLIQDASAKIMKDRTTIAIAHRLSTIQHAHRILVLVNGFICETGNHRELIEKKGVYHQLYTHQYIGTDNLMNEDI